MSEDQSKTVVQPRMTAEGFQIAQGIRDNVRAWLAEHPEEAGHGPGRFIVSQLVDELEATRAEVGRLRTLLGWLWMDQETLVCRCTGRMHATLKERAPWVFEKGADDE